MKGCDTGFGHLTALRLNKRGFHVFAGCLDPDGDGSRLLRKSCLHPARLEVLAIDVTKEKGERSLTSALQRITDSLATHGLVLHAIVNNAGIGYTNCVEWERAPSVDDYKRVLDVNLFGGIRATRTFLPLLRQSRGRVVNVTSLMARVAYPRMSAYAVSKSAFAAFTESLRYEMDRFGVKVIGVEPWFYKTPIADANRLCALLESHWKASGEEVRRAYGEDYFKMMAGLTRAALTSPLIVDENLDDVVDAIETGVNSIEPDPVYRCMSTARKALFWIIHDFLPTDVAVRINLHVFNLIHYFGSR